MRVIGTLFLALSLSTAIAVAQEAAPAKDAASVKEAAAASQSKALVYVYRYKQFAGSALSPSVYCDEVQLARMDNGRYFVAQLDPGKHTLRSNDSQSGVELDVKAGEKYFARVEIATGFMKGHGRLSLVAAEQGMYDLKSKKLKPLDADKILDKARVSAAENMLPETANNQTGSGK